MDNFVYLILASADTAAHSAAEHTSPPFWEVFVHSNFLNIAIVFGFLFFLVKKYNLFSGIDKAQQKVIEDLKSAENSRENAVKQLKEAEDHLDNAKDEADLIISNAEKLAEKIKADIIAEAEKDAERILLQARKNIENEKEQARLELQNNLTVAAIEVAKDNIQSSLDENWHRKIVQDFVDNLSSVKVK